MELFNSIEEKYSYVNALVYIASVDQNICKEEKEKIQNFCKIYGITNEELVNKIFLNCCNKQLALDEILKPITRKNQRIALINDLLALCFADGTYSEVEKDTIVTISSILDIENEKIQQLETLHFESMELNRKFVQILELQ